MFIWLLGFIWIFHLFTTKIIVLIVLSGRIYCLAKLSFLDTLFFFKILDHHHFLTHFQWGTLIPRFIVCYHILNPQLILDLQEFVFSLNIFHLRRRSCLNRSTIFSGSELSILLCFTLFWCQILRGFTTLRKLGLNIGVILILRFEILVTILINLDSVTLSLLSLFLNARALGSLQPFRICNLEFRLLDLLVSHLFFGLFEESIESL